MKFNSLELIFNFDLDMFIKWIKEINPVIVYASYDNYNNELPGLFLKEAFKHTESSLEFTLTIRKIIRPAWYKEVVKYVV